MKTANGRMRRMFPSLTIRVSRTDRNSVNRKCKALLRKGFSYGVVADATALTVGQVTGRAQVWNMTASSYRRGQSEEARGLLARIDAALGDAKQMRKEIERITNKR